MNPPEVVVPEEIRFGEYVNAVRILSDGDGEALLDLAVYSKQQNEALVIARLRCKPRFLKTLADKIESVLEERAPAEGVMFSTDGGRTAVVFPPQADEEGEA